jgi:NADH-quinone oxidoreductase subunit H
MVYGTVRLEDMVRWQAEHAWGIFVQPFAFVLFLAAANAEQKRVPFDAPEGESEIVAGYFVEYSGMKFAMFYLGEYIEIVVSSALLATIFLGGWALPFVHRDGLTIAFGNTLVLQLGLQHWGVILIGTFAFFGKVLLLCWAQLFIRWTLPRFRYDQIMKVGWRMLLPGALLNMLGTGAVLLAIDHAGDHVADGLSFAGDITQALLAVAGLAAIVLGISRALAPVPPRLQVTSTASAYAAAKGGTKMSPMQA